MIRVVVAGGRDFQDYDLLKRTLDELLPRDKDQIEIVSGHAKGADSLGERYAEENSIPLHVMKAEWNKYGKGAGQIRNRAMLDYAMEETPVVVAFWDGKSKGTKHTIETARKLGLDPHVISY